MRSSNSVPDDCCPLDQANQFGLCACRLLLSTSTMPIYCYYYSAETCHSFCHYMEGGRPSQPRHCRKDMQAVPKAVMINTTAYCGLYPSKAFSYALELFGWFTRAGTHASDGNASFIVRMSILSVPKPWTFLTSCCDTTTRTDSRPAKQWNTHIFVSYHHIFVHLHDTPLACDCNKTEVEDLFSEKVCKLHRRSC